MHGVDGVSPQEKSGTNFDRRHLSGDFNPAFVFEDMSPIHATLILKETSVQENPAEATSEEAAIPYRGAPGYGMVEDLVVERALDLGDDEKFWVPRRRASAAGR